jgi:hypothetical protein
MPASADSIYFWKKDSLNLTDISGRMMITEAIIGWWQAAKRKVARQFFATIRILS